MGNLNIYQQISVMVIPLLFAITTHEVAHGWVAARHGDATALMMGRITFNPLKHIDPIGTILVPALTIYMGGIIFGWAKPVPVNFNNLNNPRRDMALVAAAGPITNLIMAFFWGATLSLAVYLLKQNIGNALWVAYMSGFGVRINLILMVLNFLPIPPLDGSRVLESLVPPKYTDIFRQLEPFGFVILIAMLYFGLLGAIILPAVNYCQNLILSFFAIFQ